jgi:hypothetical protein
MATLGRTDISGAAYQQLGENMAITQRVTVGASDVEIHTLWAYGRMLSGTKNMKPMIWKWSDKNYIVIGDPVTITTSQKWWEFPFSSPPTLLAGTTYLIGGVFDGATVRFWGNTSGGGYGNTRESVLNYSSPTNALTLDSWSDYDMCIYVEYDEAEEPPVGYSHNVAGVDSANIKSVNTVPTANINKISGV